MEGLAQLLCCVVVVAGIVAVLIMITNQRKGTAINHTSSTPGDHLTTHTTTRQAPPPITTADKDMVLADVALGRFERAVGTNDALRQAASDIAIAGGMPTLEQQLAYEVARHRNPSLPEIDLMRPWRWLTAVAHQAAAEGDLVLVARICILTSFWYGLKEKFTANSATVRDMFEIGLWLPEAELRRDIHSIGVIHLPRLSGDTRIQHGHETVPVADVTWYSAHEICQLAEEGKVTVDPVILQHAQTIVNSRT